MKQQFATITKDRDILAARIESHVSTQLKINKAHDDTIASLREQIHLLQITITRLELAPTAPLSFETHWASATSHRSVRSYSRSHSPPTNGIRFRSRSPSESRGNGKRYRHDSDTNLASEKVTYFSSNLFWFR
ncbi:hypothetical protein B0H19DRAFT_1277359 [Mycena capillaripes]|nr:hypothetical protein B0H19DRAFT_1277359 [Mycena capillaripes]